MTSAKRKIINRSQRQLLLKVISYTILLLFSLLFLFIFSVGTGIFGKIPGKKELSEISNYTASNVYSADNYLLGRYYVENRTNSSLSDIPEFFLNALIATEDARFYKHHGVDTRSTARVLIKTILLNRETGGGSTLTQQLAKNLYPRKNLGILTLPVAKVREIMIARRLEKVYTKSEILQLYLNTVPFGDNTYGIETASLVFFNKQTSRLLPQESAVLVGMLKGNTDYNPARNYDASLKRRNIVLTQMVRYEYLNESEADSLMNLEIKLNYRKLQHDEGPAPYLRAHLARELREWARNNPRPDGSKYNIYTDGLKIYTTIDYELQVAAEEAIRDHLSRLQKEFDAHWKNNEPWKKNPMLARKEILNSRFYEYLAREGLSHEEIIKMMKEPSIRHVFTWQGEKEMKISALDSILHHFQMLQAGLISLESRTGFVKAWVGGINYKYFKYDHVTSYRQAGSTFKPFVYAEALEKGISPCTFYANDSVVYEDYDNWTPRNSDRSYGGYYSMQGALTHSVNTVSAKIIMETGIRNVTNLAKQLGFKGDIPEVPSLALGTGTVSLYELARAYSVFLNKGYLVNPVIIRRIEDQKGNVIFSQGPEISTDTIISKQTAELMTAMLTHVVNRGTASSLRTVYGFSEDIAGKTGTTQNQTDGWFVGMTPDLITAVWVGGDNPVVRFRSITYGQGAYMALPIFARYMQKVYRHPVYRMSADSRFNIPSEIQDMLACPDFREEEYDSLLDMLEKTEESIGDFIRRIFRRKTRRGEKEESEVE
jgi:penicillin-binding protein 1A